MKKRKNQSTHGLAGGHVNTAASGGVSGFLMANANQGQPATASADPALAAAESAHKSGYFDVAETGYRDILKKNPNHARALTLYGILHNRRERYKEAVRVLKKAIKIAPNQTEAFNGLGTAYKNLDMLDDAIKAYEQALKVDPNFAGAYNNMGIAYRESGYFDKAADCFSRAIELDPSIAEAWNGLARTKKFKEEPSKLDALKETARSSRMSGLAKKHAWFALGKIYDDLKQFDEAFECYRNANQNRLVPADAQKACAQMHAVASVFTGRAIETLPRIEPKESNPVPVFIVGMPRSGTTLVEQILATHPNAQWGGELNYFTDVVQKVNASGGGATSFSTDIMNMTRKDLQRIRDGFFAHFKQTRRAAGKSPLVVADKTPFNFLYLGLIAMAMPDARVIHCRRDPLDTGLSIYFTDFAKNQPFTTDLTTIGEYTRGYQCLMDHWHAVNVLPILDVDYEDLIREQEAISREMISFCELTWSDRCLSFHENKRHVSTPSDWQVRQPIYDASLARWKNYEQHLDPLRQALEGV